MATLTNAQVYALARAAGLTHEQAITATAITNPESSRITDRVGDKGLTTAIWGPSIGLWQIRSLKAQTGTGKSRDANQLKDPAFNARAMFEISEHGTNWTPWTTYNDGVYLKYVPEVRAAVGNGSGVATPGQAATVGTTSPAGVSVTTGKSPFDLNLSLGPLSGPLEGVLNAVGPMVLGSLVLFGGVALVVVGMYKASQ